MFSNAGVLGGPWACLALTGSVLIEKPRARVGFWGTSLGALESRFALKSTYNERVLFIKARRVARTLGIYSLVASVLYYRVRTKTGPCGEC